MFHNGYLRLFRMISILMLGTFFNVFLSWIVLIWFDQMNIHAQLVLLVIHKWGWCRCARFTSLKHYFVRGRSFYRTLIGVGYGVIDGLGAFLISVGTLHLIVIWQKNKIMRTFSSRRRPKPRTTRKPYRRPTKRPTTTPRDPDLAGSVSHGVETALDRLLNGGTDAPPTGFFRHSNGRPEHDLGLRFVDYRFG